MSGNSAASGNVSEEPNSFYTVPDGVEESSIKFKYNDLTKIPRVGDFVYIKKVAFFL